MPDEKSPDDAPDDEPTEEAVEKDKQAKIDAGVSFCKIHNLPLDDLLSDGKWEHTNHYYECSEGYEAEAIDEQLVAQKEAELAKYEPIKVTSPGLVEVSDVTFNQKAWDEIRDIVLNDPNIIGTPEERLHLLGSLPIDELLFRIEKTERVPKEECEAVIFLGHTLVAHYVHLANRFDSKGKERLPFALFRNRPLWMNPSAMMVGITGVGGGNSLRRLEDIGKHSGVPVGTPEGTKMTSEIDDAGRSTIQGLVGTLTQEYIKKEKQWVVNENPGFLIILDNGVATLDEMALLIVGKDVDQQQKLGELMTLLWEGKVNVNLAKGKTTFRSWSIMMGKLQPFLWDNNLANIMGFRRRFGFFVWHTKTPEERAKQYREGRTAGQSDIAALAVLRAKIVALRLALDKVTELDLSHIYGWIEKQILAERVVESDDMVFCAYATSTYLCSLEDYSLLGGKVDIPLNLETDDAMEFQVRAREELFASKEDVDNPEAFEIVNDILKDGRAEMGSVVRRKLAARLGGSTKATSERVKELMGDPKLAEETDYRPPLLILGVEEANMWNKKIGKPLLPTDKKFNGTKRVVWRDAIETMGFFEWQTQWLNDQRKDRKKAWE